MNKTFSSFFSGLLLLLLVGNIFLFLPNQIDKEKLDHMRAIVGNDGKEMTGIQQERTGVRKEIIAGSIDRLQTRVTAEKSIVDFEKKEKSYDLVERLSGVTYITEEALYPSHAVRVIKADTALYHHGDEQITADHVSFYRYLVDQEAIPSIFEGITPSMQGEGDKLTVDLKGDRAYRLSRVRGHISQISKKVK